MHDRLIRSDRVSHCLGLALVTVSLLMGGTPASAQTTHEVARRISLTHDGPLHAAIDHEVDWLVDGNRPDPQSVIKPGSNWFARHPVITGTLIGAGAGLALSRVDSIGGVNHDPRVGVLGAAIGAWSGLIASASQKVGAGQKVGVGTKIGIAAGAASLIVLPVAACYGAGGCGGSS
jgi:hypothetical protein